MCVSPSKMSVGPSPVKPLLLVGALGMFIYGPDLMKGSSFISEMQETTIALFFTLPIILLMIVHFKSELIVIPLVFLLVVFLLRNVLIGPLILLLMIQFLGKYHSSSSDRTNCDRPQGSDGEGDGIGLGGFMLMLLFLIPYTLFYEGEGYGWVSLVLVLAFITFLNMF